MSCKWVSLARMVTKNSITLANGERSGSSSGECESASEVLPSRWLGRIVPRLPGERAVSPGVPLRVRSSRSYPPPVQFEVVYSKRPVVKVRANVAISGGLG